jgi:hypothetical protein
MVILALKSHPSPRPHQRVHQRHLPCPRSRSNRPHETGQPALTTSRCGYMALKRTNVPESRFQNSKNEHCVEDTDGTRASLLSSIERRLNRSMGSSGGRMCAALDHDQTGGFGERGIGFLVREGFSIEGV